MISTRTQTHTATFCPFEKITYIYVSLSPLIHSPPPPPSFSYTDMAEGLRIVQVTVPDVVRSGSNATFVCEHDTEGDILYSVKWYKGRREFFRYTPKEIPAVKLFSVPGITVDVSTLA